MVPFARVVVLVALAASGVSACTDLLVTPGASADGSAMIAYNADSPTLYGVLYHYPRSNSTRGGRRKIYDWDSGKYLGEIDETTEETYNVVGNSNEHGLVIGESTFGGVPSLAGDQRGAVLDYGSLIYIALQRAKTARGAIRIMTDLMDAYGYASEGESFSLADASGEVWMLEAIGRGRDARGAVWVAMRIPDGAVAAHANQARIRTFPRDDPDACLYADDVVDVAIREGLYPPEADPLDFSFSDAFDPVDFNGARMSDARVWSMFSRIADGTGEFQRRYLSYALGRDVSNRMPLYVVPYRKLALADVMGLMSSHYEGTPLDSSGDVGAGLFRSPYRPRPLQWTYDNVTYHNERSIATAKTGWNFVGQIRPWMPPALSSLVWFACDDSSTAPRVPVYSSSRRISKAYAGIGTQDGVPSPLLKLDMTKAFWVQNMVSNLAYYRWEDVYPVLRKKIDSVQRRLVDKVTIIDRQALHAYQEGRASEAVDIATGFSVRAGDKLHKTWMAFYGELFVTFRDFYTITPKKDDPACGCQAIEAGLSNAMKKRIVEETRDHYRVPSIGDEQKSGKTLIMDRENVYAPEVK